LHTLAPCAVQQCQSIPCTRTPIIPFPIAHNCQLYFLSAASLSSPSCASQEHLAIYHNLLQRLTILPTKQINSWIASSNTLSQIKPHERPQWLHERSKLLNRLLRRQNRQRRRPPPLQSSLPMRKSLPTKSPRQHYQVRSNFDTAGPRSTPVPKQSKSSLTRPVLTTFGNQATRQRQPQRPRASRRRQLPARLRSQPPHQASQTPDVLRLPRRHASSCSASSKALQRRRRMT
jgi:hypothetical protein